MVLFSSHNFCLGIKVISGLSFLSSKHNQFSQIHRSKFKNVVLHPIVVKTKTI